MKSRLIFVLGLLVGLFVGSLVNMGVLSLGSVLILPPDGVDMDNLAESMDFFEVKHFIFPFLAHATGTLVGVFTACLFTREHNQRLISFFVISTLFFVGGLIMVIQLPAPLWFEITDLVIAYLPMGWLGLTIAKSISK